MIVIFLDLDETLIHSFTYRELGFENGDFPAIPLATFPIGTSPPFRGKHGEKVAERVKNYIWSHIRGFVTCWRPGLREFLLRLFDSYHRIGIWTAASRRYAFDVANVLGLTSDRLDYLLYNYHTQQADGVKKIDQLKKFDIRYSPRCTFIVDDNRQVFQAQPKNCLPVKPFLASGRNVAAEKWQLMEILPLLKERVAPC